jgi:hypothetical protein
MRGSRFGLSLGSFRNPNLLQHENILARAHLLQDPRPHCDADFSEMSFGEQQHLGARLPDSAAGRERILVIQNRLVIREFQEVELPGRRKAAFSKSRP